MTPVEKGAGCGLREMMAFAAEKLTEMEVCAKEPVPACKSAPAKLALTRPADFIRSTVDVVCLFCRWRTYPLYRRRTNSECPHYFDISAHPRGLGSKLIQIRAEVRLRELVSFRRYGGPAKTHGPQLNHPGGISAKFHSVALARWCLQHYAAVLDPGGLHALAYIVAELRKPLEQGPSAGFSGPLLLQLC